MKPKPESFITETAVWNRKDKRYIALTVAIDIDLATLAYYLGRKALENRSRTSNALNRGIVAKVLKVEATASSARERQAAGGIGKR